METSQLKEVGRVTPQSIDAESSVLGSMILDRDTIDIVNQSLREDDFYSDAHRRIYNSIMDLYLSNKPVDLITLTDKLKENDSLEIVGGVPYVSDLTRNISTTANIKYYCEIVEKKSTLRKLIKASADIVNTCYEDNDSLSSIIDFAEKSIFDITQKKSSDGLEDIRTVLIDSLKNMEELSQSDGSLTGITTGFIDLDNKTSGLQRSDLVLVAARPSMGKTAFSVNLAINAAVKANASVAIFSLEMSSHQLIQRMLSSESHIELQDIIHGKLDGSWEKIIQTMGVLSEKNIQIDDTPGITLSDLKAKCRKMKMEKGLDIVLIDYLQLMSGDGRSESRQQEISTISRGLKALAKELDCTVVALSQLSRAPELRSDHRPILSDLRESGAIEQDADIVMFLYRDEYYNPDTEKKNISELIIAKHRNGPIGTIELVFAGQYTKFLDYANN